MDKALMSLLAQIHEEVAMHTCEQTLEDILNGKVNHLPTEKVANAFTAFGADVTPKAGGEGLNISFDGGSLLTEIFFDVKNGKNDSSLCCVPTNAHAKRIVGNILDSRQLQTV